MAVQKGSDIGTESLYAQQLTLYKMSSTSFKKQPSRTFCPRENAIKLLNDIISNLQQQGHAIILVLDANQMPKESLKGNTKPYSIKWLCQQRGLQDPFIQLVNARPNSTTTTPNRDIDHVLTFGVQCANTWALFVISI